MRSGRVANDFIEARSCQFVHDCRAFVFHFLFIDFGLFVGPFFGFRARYNFWIRATCTNNKLVRTRRCLGSLLALPFGRSCWLLLQLNRLHGETPTWALGFQTNTVFCK